MTNTPELYQTVGEMNGKLDSLIELVTADRLETKERLCKVEDRTSVLEGWKWKAVGAATGVAAVVTWLLK